MKCKKSEETNITDKNITTTQEKKGNRYNQQRWIDYW
jgi:hypothetical protein